MSILRLRKPMWWKIRETTKKSKWFISGDPVDQAKHYGPSINLETSLIIMLRKLATFGMGSLMGYTQPYMMIGETAT